MGSKNSVLFAVVVAIAMIAVAAICWWPAAAGPSPGSGPDERRAVAATVGAPPVAVTATATDAPVVRSDVPAEVSPRTGSITIDFGTARQVSAALCNAAGRQTEGSAKTSGAGSAIGWEGLAAGEYRWELLSPFPLDLLPPNIRDRAAVTNRRLSGVIDLAVGEDRVIEFSMPAAVVWGVVDCGGALAGLNLQRRTDQDGMVRWKHVLEKMCELSGAFAIEHVPAGDYLLTVRWQSGFNEWGFVSREFSVADASVNLGILTPHEGVLTGRCLLEGSDGTTYEPAPGRVTLVLKNPDLPGLTPGDWVWEELPLEISRPFKVVGLYPGNHRLRVRARSGVRRVGEEEVLQAANRIEYSSHPVPGGPAVVLVPLIEHAEVSVVTRGGQDITSARFLFVGEGPDHLLESNTGHLKARLKAGRHDRVYVVARGEDGRTWVGSAALSEAVVVWLEPGLIGSGTVQSGGQPAIEDLYLSVEGGESSPLWFVRVGEDGKFTVEGMAPDWPYRSLRGYQLDVRKEGDRMLLEVTR